MQSERRRAPVEPVGGARQRGWRRAMNGAYRGSVKQHTAMRPPYHVPPQCDGSAAAAPRLPLSAQPATGMFLPPALPSRPREWWLVGVRLIRWIARRGATLRGLSRRHIRPTARCCLFVAPGMFACRPPPGSEVANQATAAKTARQPRVSGAARSSPVPQRAETANTARSTEEATYQSGPRCPDGGLMSRCSHPSLLVHETWRTCLQRERWCCALLPREEFQPLRGQRRRCCMQRRRYMEGNASSPFSPAATCERLQASMPMPEEGVCGTPESTDMSSSLRLPGSVCALVLPA